MHSRLLACAVSALFLALPATAQTTVLSGDHSIDGGLCVGADCTGTETFSGHELKIKSSSPSLLFDDTTAISRYDWSFLVNTGSNSRDFMLKAESQGFSTTPLVIKGLAPDNALYVADDGRVGMGTMLPDSELHIKTLNSPVITLEETNFAGQIWNLVASSSAFYVQDGTGSTTPFLIKETDVPGASANALVIEGDGSIGLGLQFPTRKLHIYGTDGNTRALIQEANGTTGPRTMLNLQNNGRPEIVMGNTGTGGEWSFGAGTNFILKQGAVGTDSAAKTKLFQVNANGDAILTGSLTTGGTTCGGGGCDAVFTEERVIPAAEYHAAMWAQGFLPHVGPTPENAPFNVTEKLGGMLNALEHAHVYIDAQQDRIAALESARAAERDELRRLQARTETLAAELARLRGHIARP